MLGFVKFDFIERNEIRVKFRYVWKSYLLRIEMKKIGNRCVR